MNGRLVPFAVSVGILADLGRRKASAAVAS
jgi:hypothetical protein